MRSGGGGGSSGGACHVCILGNTFGFVRDIDRGESSSLIPAAARNRPMMDVLHDATIGIGDKRRLMDCEFSFGTFGQGGGVGGVVERSTHPWRKGIALASLIGSVEGWKPIRPSDAGQLKAALTAILADHEKACAALREAESSGNAAVAELLRARGARVQGE